MLLYIFDKDKTHVQVSYVACNEYSLPYFLFFCETKKKSAFKELRPIMLQLTSASCNKTLQITKLLYEASCTHVITINGLNQKDLYTENLQLEMNKKLYSQSHMIVCFCMGKI